MQLCIKFLPFSEKKRISWVVFEMKTSPESWETWVIKTGFSLYYAVFLQKVSFKLQCPVKILPVFLWPLLHLHIRSFLWKFCEPAWLLVRNSVFLLSACLFLPKFLGLVQNWAILSMHLSLQRCQSTAAGMKGKALSWYSCWHFTLEGPNRSLS